MNRGATTGIGNGTNGRHPNRSDQPCLARLGSDGGASGGSPFAELLPAPRPALLVAGAPRRQSTGLPDAPDDLGHPGYPGTSPASNPAPGTAPGTAATGVGDPDPLAGPGPDLEIPTEGVPGYPLLADPQHGEPVLISALAVAGALTCWATAAPRPAWITTAALVPLSAWAVRPGAPGRLTNATTMLRGLLVLAAALATTLLAPNLSGLAVIWVLAMAALYPVPLPRQAATALTSLGALTLCLPAATALLRGDVEAAGDPALLAGTVAAATVAAGLGVAAAYVRAALTDSTLLAEQRHAVARSTRDELVRVTSNDGLTNLPNQATLLRRIIQGLARADVIGGQLALFVLEIDRFTAITDTLGAAGGDEVLRQVARRLRAAMPAEDVVARIGSRRFAVLVEGIGPEGGTGMARRMTALLEEPMASTGRTVSITCSIGIVVASPELSAPEELMRAAEEALLASQHNGRTRWATYDQAMRAHARFQGTLEIELRQAVRNGRIGAAFQPVLALGRGDAPDRVCGLEMVARWTRDDGTAVPTLRFIPVAEELGLAPVLGLQLLDQGLSALLSWHDAGLRVASLALNVDYSQLEDPDYARNVAARLHGCGIEPNRLVVEIPAAGFVDTEQTRNSLGMLRSLDVGIIVDGFGRAGMSLAALRQLPVTGIKLDRSLTADLDGDGTVPATVVALCRSLGLRCLVDGIETQAQLAAARALGVDAVQGHLIGRPVAADDVLGALVS